MATRIQGACSASHWTELADRDSKGQDCHFGHGHRSVARVDQAKTQGS
jgi:hypothetical protein